jgi:DNA-binding LacI/PurR family transcriptional regulator
VPDDVAVVGYDDVELASLTEPALSTVRQPVAEQAATMTGLLLRQISGEPPGEPVVLPVELVCRESG